MISLVLLLMIEIIDLAKGLVRWQRVAKWGYEMENDIYP